MNRIGSDTVAVITGASGGVGRATARLFGESRRKSRPRGSGPGRVGGCSK